MRSPREISFRLKQELRNIQLALVPPSCKSQQVTPLSLLPDPHPIADHLRTTAFASDVLHIADEILAHRFPLLGYVLNTGPTIEWRRDYLNNISSEPKYFRLVPYLDPAKAGDHKNIWELNRHQHLVLLAQAFLFSKKQAYLDTIWQHLESWWEKSPFQRGINWTSALEVAFRAFSWIWVFHFVGERMPTELRARFLTSLCQHGDHLANNLSFYFSPNTHLLGEAVVLHALGVLFPAFPRAKQWAALGGKTVAHEMTRQIRKDGGYFEQSTYYHVYALDMFLFHALLTRCSDSYLASLSSMADFLQAVLGPQRRLAFLGDDDGGRWFHPYGRRDEFGRATLAVCGTFFNRQDWTYDTEDLYPHAAWFLGKATGSAKGQHGSRIFSDTGIAALQSGDGHVLFDVGPFGPGRAGHSHSDALTVVANHGGRDLLVDSGTYTYVGDAGLRDEFRGSAAHNTIRIDSRDQATPVGPFWWGNPPEVDLLSWKNSDDEDRIVAQCKYDGFLHRRLVRFVKPNLLFILDFVEGPPGEHEWEQFWHLGAPDVERHIFFGKAHTERTVWHSCSFGERHQALCLVVKQKSSFPVTAATALVLDGNGEAQVYERAEEAVFNIIIGGDTQQYAIPWPR